MLQQFRLLLGLMFLIILDENISSFARGDATPPTVDVPTGRIEGYWALTNEGRVYAAFAGIPYAKPPVGNRRFQKPEPVGRWSGTWQAKYLYKCLQYNHYTEPGEDFVIGDEDCLYLNVYTPSLNKTAPLEVIVYVHGGAFMFNSGGSYGPAFLMNRNIVYVTMNYRLGPLGFLSTEDSLIPGNNGLRDQLLALQWVKANIKYFGGNPESITLTGMSAGGSSVQLHYLSPLSDGLFHRGIAQSGTALNPWVLMENGLLKTRRLASKVGCEFESVKDMVDCMKQRTGRQIVDAVKHFLPWLYNPFSPFGVVVDKWSDDPIIPEHPFVLLKKKRVKNLPIIFSSVESEGMYPAADFIGDPIYLDEIEEKWSYLIPFVLDFNGTVHSDEKLEVTRRIKQQYFGGEKVSKATFQKLVKMITDRLFLVDIQRAARLHAAASVAPTYYYFFSYRGAHSKSELRSHSNVNYGASHGDDTVYVLSSNVDVHSTHSDAAMSEILLNMWTNYSLNSEPKLGAVVWTSMAKDESAPLIFAHVRSPFDIRMETSADLGNGQFWDGLNLQENQNCISDVFTCDTSQKKDNFLGIPNNQLIN